MLDNELTIVVDGDFVRCAFVKVDHVAPGVVAYLYDPIDVSEFDVARVEVAPGNRTPRQRVLNGSRTIERFDSGGGTFTHVRQGTQTEYRFPSKIEEIEVQVGDEMQWLAGDGGLIFIELCWPPFAAGRFLDL
jgi:hypothetical protein